MVMFLYLDVGEWARLMGFVFFKQRRGAQSFSLSDSVSEAGLTPTNGVVFGINSRKRVASFLTFIMIQL